MAIGWMVMVLLLLATLGEASEGYASTSSSRLEDYVRQCCKGTEYPALCDSTLSPYANELKAPKEDEMTKLAVKMSLLKSSNMSKWAAALSKGSTVKMSKKEKAALKDCVENLQYSTEQQQQSLATLKHLRTYNFRMQMSDCQTWMSASLTNYDSCLDGFDKKNSSFKRMFKARLQTLCQMTSNSLVLVNKLAYSKDY